MVFKILSNERKCGGVIHQLRKQGHSIYIITGRALANRNNILGKIMRSNVKKWLSKNRIEYDDIYFVSTENSSTEKQFLCKELHIDYMVEDDPDNIESISNVCNIVCIDADYNRNLSVKHSRAYDFNDVFTIIQSGNSQKLKSGTELDSMTTDEKKVYISKIQQYYKSLPFDMRFVNQYKSSQRKNVIRLGWLINFFNRIKICGNDNIPKDRNVIFVSNHRRSFDIPLLYVVLKRRQPRLLVKEECEFSGYGEIIRKIGIIFVKRESKTSRKMANSIMIHNVLRGQDVLIFPEGTRNKTSAALLPFKRGAAFVAQMTGHPIVPVVINKNGFKYNVTIDKPVYVEIEDSIEYQTELLRKRMESIYECGK